jgi:excisionase family DNA binding protein
LQFCIPDKQKTGIKMNLTFNDLPNAVATLFEKVIGLELLLKDHLKVGQSPQSETLLTIGQATELLNLSKSTIYGLIHRKEIPVMKRGNRVYFSKQELTNWIVAGRKKTKEEIEAEAEAHLTAINKNRRSY